MDDNNGDGVESEENYYAFLNVSTSASFPIDNFFVISISNCEIC